MPRQDPAAWREAREMWESSDMTLSDVAARLDVAIPTASLRAKRECWVKSDVVSLDRASYSPKQLVEIAVRSLVRAASQTKDIPSAVKAAGMLLERTMGRVVTEQTTPMLSHEAVEASERDWPEWMDRERLSYHRGTPEEPLS